MKAHERKPAPDLDAWMLDHWVNPALHVVSVMIHTDASGSQYRSTCSCGWRAIPFVRPLVEVCPILEALRDRQRRIKKADERVDWTRHRPLMVDTGTAPELLSDGASSGRTDAELDRRAPGECDPIRHGDGSHEAFDPQQVIPDPRD